MFLLNTPGFIKTSVKALVLGLLAALVASCAEESSTAAEDSGLTSVIVQTDWYAQPEHGGFYQALAKGFYEEEGLQVEIRPGANLNGIPQLVATNRVNFAIGAIETILIYRSRNIPLVSMFPYFQHDPQCVLFHQESGIETLMDLDGREIMFQADNLYLYFIEAMGIEYQLLPMDWGLARFMSDKEFVQQCFLTSEPLTVKRNGVTPGFIPLSQTGFDPYRHVYTSERQIAEDPATVAAFTRASIKGWKDFMENDPTPGLELIMVNNPQQNVEHMLETLEQMKLYSMTEGDVEKGEELGQYNKARLRKVMTQLEGAGLFDGPVLLEESVAFDLLPEHLLVDYPLIDDSLVE